MATKQQAHGLVRMEEAARIFGLHADALLLRLEAGEPVLPARNVEGEWFVEMPVGLLDSNRHIQLKLELGTGDLQAEIVRLRAEVAKLEHQKWKLELEHEMSASYAAWRQEVLEHQPDWEGCQLEPAIDWRYSDHPHRAGVPGLYFLASAHGPYGPYVAGESPKFPARPILFVDGWWSRQLTDYSKDQPDVQAAFNQLVYKLISDGWEPVKDPAPYFWYNQRFKRQVGLAAALRGHLDSMLGSTEQSPSTDRNREGSVSPSGSP